MPRFLLAPSWRDGLTTRPYLKPQLVGIIIILSCVSLLWATQFLERGKKQDAIDTIQLSHPVEGIRTFSFLLGLGFWCNGNCKSKRLGVRCRLFLGRHVKGSAAR
jgi:hypothetical protein